MKYDEVPVASVICSIDVMNDSGNPGNFIETIESFIKGENISGLEIIGSGINRIVKEKDSTAHGEMQAVRSACRNQNSERLSKSFILTTLEPCIMCAGAILLARLDAVIYMAPALSGVGMKTLLTQNPEEMHAFNHYPKLYHLQNYEERASEMLRSFFRLKRSS
jgi:tRNA(adenine34) deaminase